MDLIYTTGARIDIIAIAISKDRHQTLDVDLLRFSDIPYPTYPA